MRRLFTIRYLSVTGGLVLVGLIIVTGILWGRLSLPYTTGQIAVPGFREPVSVFRDRLGVPRIRADNADDAYAALGFVHAQDRMWQMDAMRRLVSGRLAEVLGPQALPSDRFMRLLGFHRLVQDQLKALKPETRDALESYAHGVNAWLRFGQQALPPEFAILGYEPEPWKPQDSLLWGRLMALRLSGNWRDEILRAKMLETLSNQEVLSFWYPDKTPLRTGADTLQNRQNAEISERLLSLFPGQPGLPKGASNAWVVSGDLAEHDRPVLANDPHLAFALPSTWYLARIETPSFALTGATVPGLPFLVLGHNETVAWGMTSTQADQQDVYIERVSGDGKSYLTPAGQYVPFGKRQESIAVYGHADETMTVRETVHGPVISDLLGGLERVVGDDTVLALSATFLESADTTPDAMMGMNKARHWPGFEAALMRFRSPQMNIVYADVGGTIGFMAPGAVPIRRAGRGRFPVPGWNGGYAWDGMVPFESLPRSVNPPAGKLVSANNSIVADDYPYFISDDWAPGYRATRIFQLLDAVSPVTVPNTTDIQLDTVSEMARELLPAMTAFVPRNPRAAEAVSRLTRWDGTMSKGAVEPLVFYAWLRELNKAVYADELGPLFAQAQGLRPKFILRVLSSEQQWCDDRTTVPVEGCGEMLEGTLVSALAKLKTMGPDGKPVHRWGAVHKAAFQHPLLSSIPLLSDLWGLREQAVDGGNYTINRAATRPADDKAPFADIHGPGFRAIYDLSDLSQSRFVISTGQSGVPLSDHFDDMLPVWSAGHYIRIGSDIRNATDTTTSERTRLILIPAGRNENPDGPWIDGLIPFLDSAARMTGIAARKIVNLF